MRTSQKINIIIPFVILFALLGLLYRELFYAKPHDLPSALIGEPLPSFTLPNLFVPTSFTENNLKGHVVLLNVFATWCYACSLEEAMLMKIKNEYHVAIYGIDYKDKSDDAKSWLLQNGNPYMIVGEDKTGDVAIDLGVYGTPETFVIANGKIVYRHVGLIDQEAWDTILYPLVKKYRGEFQ